MKHLLALLFLITFLSCSAQETIILEKTKVEWSDYPGLYQDSTKTTFKKHLHFLEKVDMYEITYLSDGLKIQAFAAVPKAKGIGRWFGVFSECVYNRGGNRDFGALQLFKNGERAKYPVSYHFSKLANEGYVVVGCNYRGCGESEGQDEFGGKDVNDVLNLIEAVNEIPKADATRIGMYGWSRGGMMTYLTLPRTTKIKAAVVGGAPTDKTVIDRPNMETNVYAQLMPNYWENKEAELKKRSAVYFADKFPTNVPLLILHGNADWRVKSTQSLQLALELEKHRVPYRLKIFEGGDHALSQYREERDEDVINWFERYLKKDEALPKMDFHGN